VVYAVQGLFGFRNAKRRDAVMTNVQTQLASKVTWGETQTSAIPTAAGDPGLAVQVRFTVKAERDQFWTDVIAFLGTGINGPTTASYIQQHDCPHDEAAGRGCVVSQRRDY
jgi:hypothetical protein